MKTSAPRRSLVALLTGALIVGPALTAIEPAKAATANVSAKALLSQLPVKAEVKTGYARTKFKHWTDADKDRCNTRKEVLLGEATKKPRVVKRTCAISGGKWTSKYDGKTTTKSSALDIDHMVPLKEAWDSGANKWTAATREKFANDLGYGPSLIAVTAKTNQSKGDRDLAGWQPPRTAYRCTYAKQWVAVKWRWKLSVDAPEKNAITGALAKCGTNLKIAKPSRATVKTATTTAKPTKNDPKYGTCRAAIAAGYGPYVRGKDPEYSWYRDADKDGVVCE
jgi:hypothetical protein